MLPEKRFGMGGVVRYRLYCWLAFLFFIGVVFGGDFYRPVFLIAFVTLGVWAGIFDRVGRGGNEQFLGFPKDRAALYLRSVFGKKTDD